MEVHVSERIKLLIETRAKGNKSAFGRAVGLTPQAVMDILEAKSGPGFASLQKILKGYPDISSEWLIFGEGEMLKGQPSEDAGGHHVAALLTESDALLKLAVAEAKLEQKDQQLADKDRLIDRLWALAGVPEKMGKLLSSSDAALTRVLKLLGISLSSGELAAG